MAKVKKLATDIVPQTPGPLGRGGVTLSTVDDMLTFSEVVLKSGLAPAALRTKEAIAIALEMGAEVGLPPMAALQNIAVVKGKPSIYGDAAMAIVRASGAFVEGGFSEKITGEEGSDDRAAVVTMQRRGGEPYTVTFSVRDAKRAGLWGSDSPWRTYPADMLTWKARHRVMKALFSDVLRGFHPVEPKELVDHGTEVRTDPRPEPRTLKDLVASNAPQGRGPCQDDAGSVPAIR